MKNQTICPECGLAFSPSESEDLCPSCLMANAICEGPSVDDAEIPVEYLSELFPNLTFGELLGDNMATVYRATQHGINRDVVFKAFAIENSTGESEVDRFRQEAEAVANLRHPNIVTVHDFGLIDGIYYFIMDYIAGQNLRQTCKGQSWSKTEKAKKVAQWLSQICDALHHAHGQGIIHRDVKPDNIVIGNDGIPVLIDFGIAKGHQATSLLKTQTGDSLGTPAYMSPEQCADSSKVDCRSDVYALGAVLFELWTEQPPIGQWPAPNKGTVHLDELDERIRQIATKAMSTRPEARYQDAREFRSALLAVLKDPNTPRKPETSGKVERKAITVAKFFGNSVSTLVYILIFFVFSLASTYGGLMLGHFMYGDYHGETIELGEILGVEGGSDQEYRLLLGLFHDLTDLGPDLDEMKKIVLLFALGAFFISLVLNLVVAWKQSKVFSFVTSYALLTVLVVAAFMPGKSVPVMKTIQEIPNNGVSASFQIERLEKQIEEFDAEIKSMSYDLAKSQGERDKLLKNVRFSSDQLKAAIARIDQLEKQFRAGSSKETFKIDGRTYTKTQAMQHLAILKSKRETAENIHQRNLELLAAKTRDLENDEKRLAELKDARLKAASLLEECKATAQASELKGLESEIKFDESKISSAKKLLDELNKKLEVQKRVLDADTKSIDMIPIERNESDVDDEASKYFDSNKKPSTSRKKE